MKNGGWTGLPGKWYIDRSMGGWVLMVNVGKYYQWLFLVPVKGGQKVADSPPIGSLYHLYTTYIPCLRFGVICYLPPATGTRNNHWYYANAMDWWVILVNLGAFWLMYPADFAAGLTTTNTIHETGTCRYILQILVKLTYMKGWFGMVSHILRKCRRKSG